MSTPGRLGGIQLSNKQYLGQPDLDAIASMTYVVQQDRMRFLATRNVKNPVASEWVIPPRPVIDRGSTAGVTHHSMIGGDQLDFLGGSLASNCSAGRCPRMSSCPLTPQGVH